MLGVWILSVGLLVKGLLQIHEKLGVVQIPGLLLALWQNLQPISVEGNHSKCPRIPSEECTGCGPDFSEEIVNDTDKKNGLRFATCPGNKRLLYIYL